MEGSIIPTTLTHRIDGELPSRVKCMVTTDVYAPGYQVVVVPAGSWVIGESRPVSSLGQRRLAIVFHRIIRPDDVSISLDGSATNNMGETGLQSHVDTHYWSALAAAGAVGLIAGLAEASADTGLDATTGDYYRRGVAGNMSQSGMRILDARLNRLPSIGVDENSFVMVRLLTDLDVPPYTPPAVPMSFLAAPRQPSPSLSPRSTP
jgi:type IV secretion system protein TrbI